MQADFSTVHKAQIKQACALHADQSAIDAGNVADLTGFERVQTGQFIINQLRLLLRGKRLDIDGLSQGAA